VSTLFDNKDGGLRKDQKDPFNLSLLVLLIWRIGSYNFPFL
jgi:hypothetical protein